MYKCLNFHLMPHEYNKILVNHKWNYYIASGMENTA